MDKDTLEKLLNLLPKEDTEDYPKVGRGMKSTHHYRQDGWNAYKKELDELIHSLLLQL